MEKPLSEKVYNNVPDSITVEGNAKLENKIHNHYGDSKECICHPPY